MRRSGARTLLMGGQACVFYGAAEFSRDLDLLVPADVGAWAPVQIALAELRAEPIAVPPPDPEYLLRGHALHFRCRAEDVEGLRLDFMARPRGVASFDEVWKRRTSVESDDESTDMLALPDLVASKKTQRDKDWPMIRRLVEQSYFAASSPDGEPELVEFWLRELRTPELLIELTRVAPNAAREHRRPAVRAAVAGDADAVEAALADEVRVEREADRAHWAPLRAELERLRHG